MASRERGDAVICDPEQAARQVLGILEEKALISSSGKRIPAEVHTFCIHGDEPTAVQVMRKVRERLAAAGVEVVSLPALFGLN
ncbi:hypothetical protein D9M70_639690 [compost metagenome]